MFSRRREASFRDPAAKLLHLRFQPRDLLAIPGVSRLATAQLLTRGGQVGLDGKCAGFVPFKLQRMFGRRRAQLRQRLLHSRQLFAERPPIDHADLRAQLLQAGAVLAVAIGLGRLRAHGLEAVFDLLDDVAQPQQILIDAFQPPLGFDFFRLEPADAGGLLKDSAAVLRRGLEQAIDLALLDEAVGIDANARAAEQVANVLEAAGITVDEIFAFAAAIDAARDVDFRGVDGELVRRIVENDRRLGHVHGLAAAAARALEDDVGHVAAAEAFGALLAEDPLDGVDDVRLAAAVGTDDDRDAGGKLKARFVGEALEADKFECLEHGGRARGPKLLGEQVRRQ
jgi:hypothetical protein